MGLLKPCAGTIEIFGQPIKKENDFFMVRQRIGMLFQDADDQLFCPTVIEDVAFGPLNLGKSREQALEISLKTLEFLGLKDFQDRITFKLSGGEKKLVSLATVLAMEPEILLLDEPTGGLDNAIKEKLKNILSALDISIMVISHEMDFLYRITDSLYTIKNKTVTSNGEFRLHKHVHTHKLGGQPHKHD
jgi:cobalt/nickel transport system ATP-binding protein